MALLLSPGTRLGNAAGTVLNAAKVRVYNVNTTTLSTIYSDSAMTVPLSNPVTTNSAGYPSTDGSTATLIFAATGNYDVAFLDSSNNVLVAYDDVPTVGEEGVDINRTLSGGTRFKVSDSGGIVLMQVGDVSPDNIGGKLTMEGWAGTQGDILHIDFASVTFSGTSGLGLGKHAIWVPVSAMVSRTTNGAASGLTETATNRIMSITLDFDASTIEYAQFSLRMPASWNEGTVTFVPEWSHAATATNFKVSWGLQAVALSDGEALDTAFGTAQYSNDTGGTTDTVYAGPESSAITIAGTPAAQDLVVFQVLRKADDATNDTMTIDARLHGVTVFLTTDAMSDD